MAFSGKTYTLPRIQSYEDALAHFTTTKPVHARKHVNRWTPDTRPLKNSSAWPYRMERRIDARGNAFFDIMLYHTIMARFYKPEVVGGTRFQTRYYTSHYSQTSKSFMGDVLGMNWLNCIKDLDGVDRAVPIGTCKVHDNNTPVPHEFGCKLFLVDGKLDLTASDHQPLYRKFADKDDRERTAWARERVAPLMALLPLRMQTFEDTCIIDRLRGKPFGGKSLPYGNGYSHYALCDLFDARVPLDTVLTDAAAQSFFMYAQECYNTLASKRSVAMNKDNTNMYWRSPRPATDDPRALDRPITAEELYRSVSNNLVRDFCRNRQSGREQLPKFMEYSEFPNSNRGYY